MKVEGFDGKQVKVTVRWFEKVARHGEEAMRLGEQTFHLYRGTVENRPDRLGPVTTDPKLATAFAPKKEPPRGNQRVAAALAWAKGDGAE